MDKEEMKEIQVNDIIGYTTARNPIEVLGRVKYISTILSAENKEEEGILIYRVFPVNEPNVSYTDVYSLDVKSHYIKQYSEVE